MKLLGIYLDFMETLGNKKALHISPNSCGFQFEFCRVRAVNHRLCLSAALWQVSGTLMKREGEMWEILWVFANEHESSTHCHGTLDRLGCGKIGNGIKWLEGWTVPVCSDICIGGRELCNIPFPRSLQSTTVLTAGLPGPSAQPKARAMPHAQS